MRRRRILVHLTLRAALVLAVWTTLAPSGFT
jgi:hypothetical protein